MWFKIQDQIVKVWIIAKPHAKKSALINIDENALQVTLHAKPHKGEANDELVMFLSKLFRVPKSKIILEKGTSSKYKQVTMPLTAEIQKILDDPRCYWKKEIAMRSVVLQLLLA